MSARARRMVAAALGALALAVGACGDVGASDGARDERGFDDEVARLRSMLLHGGSEITAREPVAATAVGVTAGWELELSISWPEYAAWARERLAPAFEPGDGAADRLVFRRATHADRYTVVIERLGERAARVELSGAPW